jgi:integrase
MPTENLTAARVNRLKRTPPKAGRVEVWDAKTPGLCLRISATGAASWSFRYRPRNGGRYQRVTLGALSALGLADARERAARHRVGVTDGADPQRERMAKRAAAANALTFDRLAQRYLDEYARPRKSSWQNDASYLKRPRECWGDRDAKTISRRDAIVLLDDIKSAAPVSANRTHSVLVTLFNWAVEDQLLDFNPLAGLKKRAAERAKERMLSDAEIRVLWRALEDANGTSDDIALALRVLLLVGQRPGEVAGALQHELIDLDSPDARWEIPAARTKGRRPHVVPLAPMARELFLEAVARRRSEGDKAGVFASRFFDRETLARHSLSRALKRVIAQLAPEGPEADAIRSVKANPPTPHDFRRTVATGLAALGIAREDRLAVLAHVAGDIHGTVYDRYERLKEKRAALAVWERHLAKVLGRPQSSAAVVPMRRGRP